MKGISLLLDSSKSGGIETHVANLAKALQQKGLEVQVILWKQYHDKAHPLDAQMRAANIPFHYANGCFSILTSLVKKGAILHTHGYKANLIGKFGSILGKWNAFPTHHNGDVGDGLLKKYVMLDEITSRWFSPISVSDEIFERLGNRGIKVKNFVFTPDQTKIEEVHVGPIRQIAFVGRISEEKDPDAFCQIGEAIQKDEKHSHLSFHVYGGGEDQSQLMAKYPGITFHGEQDMSQHWPKIDLLCITSKTEGLPLAALEAMSHGIPVASFAVGDLPRLISHGHNGWIVPKGQIQTMKDTLVAWENLNPGLQQNMKRHAYNTIEQDYSTAAVIPAIIQHYQNV
ncbi:glycosyltransferase family 4 protein [Marinomonas transparens]|uniref:Glycosyltransferase family 4 protein n=1 Tax=Marinomonas transparens TaxID=2795388 RepID=A0A934JLY9_9GAMM|nr:glycosyltransferase family 4 protein [Marinomonas transparens]MBJ7538246.1 glycosyltransferase family 4 protein [Marinomonas transparens]